MNEDELDQYLDAVDRLDTRLGPTFTPDERPIFEQLRDEDGLRVPGCYRAFPKPGDIY